MSLLVNTSAFCHSVCTEVKKYITIDMCAVTGSLVELNRVIADVLCLFVYCYSTDTTALVSCMQAILDCLCDQEIFATKHWGTIQAIFLCAEAILAGDFKMSSAQEKCFLTVLLRLGAARMDDDMWQKKVQCVCVLQLPSS